MRKITKKIGLIKLSEYDELKCDNKNLKEELFNGIKLISELNTKVNELNILVKELSPKEIVPDREFIHGQENWDDYWNECYADKYNAKDIVTISKHPEILTDLIYKISIFDWNDIEKFMKETNWFWGDRKDRTPNVVEMQRCVVSLAASAIYRATDVNNSGCQSGGFLVETINGEIKITFKKHL